MVTANDIFFPDANDLTQHAVAFARMMIAHARFEAEFRTLQGIVAGDATFGEQHQNQWSASKRAKFITKLIKSKIGRIDALPQITDVLKRAREPTDDRNLLAHGEWWRLSQDGAVLTVRRSKMVEGRCKHVDWTVAQINNVAERFDDLEADLNTVRRAIEHQYFPQALPEV